MTAASRLIARLGRAAALLLGAALPALAHTTTPPVYVRLITTLGVFTLGLDSARAPLSVANFTRYVQDKHYDGTIFHRVVGSFVVQGGGYLPDGTEKPTRPGVPMGSRATFEDETPLEPVVIKSAQTVPKPSAAQ